MEIQSRYDTEDVAPIDRFAYWRDAVCDSYVQLGCETPDTVGFKGRIDIARHSVLSISKVAGLAQRVDRRKRDIRASTEAYFLLSLQDRRSATVSQFDKTAMLRTGDMALYSSADPYQLQLTDDFSQTVIQLPADALIRRLPNAEQLTARRIDGQTGIGKLVRETILAFSAEIDAASPTLQSLLQETLIDLIATGLATQSSDPVALSAPDQQVMLRARSFIRSHLGDPDLDRSRVAAQIGLSVRRLNGIFAKEGTSISAMIRHMRLESVAEALRDPRFAPQSISDLAFRHGFSNMQNFSTIFRAAYGMSPRAYRALRE